MLKKLSVALIAAALLLGGCKAAPKKSIKTTQKTTSRFFEKEVNSVKVVPGIRKIEVSWEVEDLSDVKQILLVKKEKGGSRKSVKVDKTEANYVFDVMPQVETTIFVKLISTEGKASKGKSATAVAKVEPALVKANEYIETDSNTVKMLFQTNDGANVIVKIGEDINYLKEITINDFSRKEPVKITGLEPNKTYNYQIISKYEGETFESEMFSFRKAKINDSIEQAEWARKAVFYEVFVRSFADGNGDNIGDFIGLANNLDYLKDLGVDALWLMPMFSSDTYHGYDVTDYYNTENEYGTIEDFKYLLEEAHKKDIKIIIDFIVNHSSANHPWFVSAASSKQSEFRDYYNWDHPFEDITKSGPWGQNQWYESGDDNYLAIFWSQMPDLNFRNPVVREEIKKAGKFWLDLGVDGFRLDASKHIDDVDKEMTLSWWKDFSGEMKSHKEDAFIVGENWDENPEVIAPFFNTMDSSFNFGLSYQIIELANGGFVDVIETVNSMKEIYSKYENDFIDTTFIRNHDMNRVYNEVGKDESSTRLAAALLFTLPGTPFLYYGEEIGQMGAKPDPNIREPFDWYASAKGNGMTTMEKGGFGERMTYTHPNDGISVEEQIEDPNSMYNYYKKLIKIRKDNPVLFDGEYRRIDDSDVPEGLLAYEVRGDGTTLIIVHNINQEGQTIPLEGFEYDILLGTVEDGNLKLGKKESAILKY